MILTEIVYSLIWTNCFVIFQFLNPIIKMWYLLINFNKGDPFMLKLLQKHSPCLQMSTKKPFSEPPHFVSREGGAKKSNSKLIKIPRKSLDKLPLTPSNPVYENKEDALTKA